MPVNTSPSFFTRAGIVTTPVGTGNDYGRRVFRLLTVPSATPTQRRTP